MFPKKQVFLVLGLSRSGESGAEFLLSKNASVYIYDDLQGERIEKTAKALEEKGAKRVAIADLSRDDMAEAVEDAFRHDKLVVAASTYDGGLFPCMEDFLSHLKAKNFQKRTVVLMVNGTWAPMAAKKMREYLEGMKEITICEPVVTIKSAMKEETLKVMEELAEKLV